MDRFFDQINTWLSEAGADAATGVEVAQRALLVGLLVLVIIVGIAYMGGFIPMRYLEQIKGSWVGMAIAALLIVFVLAPMIVALI